MAVLSTNDIYVENGATVQGTTGNDRFIITKDTGNATIEAGLKGNDTLYFNTPLTNYYARYVKDTKEALIEIGKYYVEQYNPYIVGITGSVGKTTTRNMVHAVLSKKYETLKNETNQNNETVADNKPSDDKQMKTSAKLMIGASTLATAIVRPIPQSRLTRLANTTLADLTKLTMPEQMMD